MNKVEEIKNEQDVQIDTSITLLQEIQNPYPLTQPDPESVVSEREIEEEKKILSELENMELEEPLQVRVSSQHSPVDSTKQIEEEKKRLSEGLEDLAEQSLISDSSHNTEFDTEQLQPIQGIKLFKLVLQ